MNKKGESETSHIVLLAIVGVVALAGLAVVFSGHSGQQTETSGGAETTGAFSVAPRSIATPGTVIVTTNQLNILFKVDGNAAPNYLVGVVRDDGTHAEAVVPRSGSGSTVRLVASPSAFGFSDFSSIESIGVMTNDGTSSIFSEQNNACGSKMLVCTDADFTNDLSACANSNSVTFDQTATIAAINADLGTSTDPAVHDFVNNVNAFVTNAQANHKAVVVQYARGVNVDIDPSEGGQQLVASIKHVDGDARVRGNIGAAILTVQQTGVAQPASVGARILEAGSNNLQAQYQTEDPLSIGIDAQQMQVTVGDPGNLVIAVNLFALPASTTYNVVKTVDSGCVGSSVSGVLTVNAAGTGTFVHT